MSYHMIKIHMKYIWLKKRSDLGEKIGVYAEVIEILQ